MIMEMMMRRMGLGHFTPHGFRSSFRDWAAEETSFPREIAEMCLAHTVGTQVERAYRRSDLLDKRRQLLVAWAAYCSSACPIMTETVVMAGTGDEADAGADQPSTSDRRRARAWLRQLRAGRSPFALSGETAGDETSHNRAIAAKLPVPGRGRLHHSGDVGHAAKKYFDQLKRHYQESG